MSNAKLHYLVMLNCEGIKKGTISEAKAEAFEQEMIAKHSDNGKNLIEVWFR